MKESRNLIRLPAIVVVMAFAGYASAQQQSVQFAGVPCATPPVLHCPDKDCPPDRVINPGTVVEMKTRRTYFLDYPCDLKKGEQVTFILSLHGFGSYGNWQRHYFPIMDYKDKYRLVIVTPNSPTRSWSVDDDEYLQNIVNSVIDQLGTKNIKAFWLVGHSQGGLTSNRIVRTDLFKDKVDGWLSLSGGRLGGNPGRSPSWGPPRAAAPAAAPADRGVRWRRLSKPKPATSMTARVRIRLIRPGDCCPRPARRRSTFIRAARIAGSWPTSSASTRDTRKGSSRKSPRS